MAEQRLSNGHRESVARIKFLLSVVVLLGVVAVGRLFYLQVLRHDFYVEAANSQHWAQDVIQAKRGKILVRDATTGGLYPLADNKTLYLVFAAPVEIADKTEAAKRIAPVVGISETDILKLIENNHTYVVLKHGLEYDVSQKIESFGIRGIYTSKENARYYPEKRLASQVLGFVNAEGVGSYGIEQYYNKELAGTAGLYKAEIDPTGRRIAFGQNVSKEAVDGSDVILTINRDVQSEAEKLLDKQVKSFHAKNGSIIVMNPDNGEILAMANYPTYDPNKYQAVKDYNLFKNSAVQDLFEPGSIFKVITMAAGLDDGKVEPDSTYRDRGRVELDGHTIMNSDRKTNGIQTMTQVLEKSLNTGTTHVMQLLGKSKFYDYLVNRFHFSEITGIEQPNEASGNVSTPDSVNDHTYATISFGQSISTTPIRMITAFAAVANGGKLVKPHLVAEMVSPEGEKSATDNRPVAEVMSESAAAKLRQMMVSVVVRGHGKQAAVKGYDIAGKTGTAQVPLKNGGGYDPYNNIGSFIGFGPAESARYVVMAKIDSPKGVPWAESTAAPIVGEMLDYLFKYYQVPPTR